MKEDMRKKIINENVPILLVLNHHSRHIPKAKATAIADTPELKRIAENTKIQSNVKYHADFEKNKGKLTQVGFLQISIKPDEHQSNEFLVSITLSKCKFLAI